MKKFYLILALCIITPYIALAQEITITGKVTDNENGWPLPGVNIVIKGTRTGTITDLDGNYSLKADKNAILTFSFVGYSTEEVVVKGRTNINIALAAEVSMIDETVVIGYGTVKKNDVTGAISSVQSEDIADLAAANLNQAIQGKVSGVEIINNSGSPGAGITMRVRGMGTLNSGASPLYVIDGFIQGDQSFGKEGNEVPDNKQGIAFLDPADIESIEILKDASAAAIYGARGANGVVLITTKKGKSGKTKIDLNIQHGIQKLPHKYDIMNGNEYRKYKNEAYAILGRPPLDGFEEGMPIDNFDWQDYVFSPAPKQKYKVTVSGGSEKNTFLVSGSYFNQDGIVENSGLEKYTFRFNAGQNISKHIKFGQNIIVNYSERQRINENGFGVTGSPVGNALFADPTSTPYYTQEEVEEENINTDLNWGLWRDLTRTPKAGNPAANLDMKRYDYKAKRYYGTAFLDVNIFPFLKFHSTFGMDITDGHMEEFNPFYEINSTDKQAGTRFYMREEQWINWDFENTLTFSKTFNKHDVNLMAGYTSQKESFVDTRHQVLGFPYLDEELRYMNIANLESIEELKSTPMAYSFSSILGRLIYTYNNMLTFTGSIRHDGSSRFGPNNKYGTFPSFALGYKISEMPFWRPLETTINFMKIRVGYGKLGNASIPINQYLSLMNTTDLTAAFGHPGSVKIGSLPEGLSNEDVKWETTAQKNIALDMGFFGDKLNFSVDFYHKTTNDLLLPLPIPQYAGHSYLHVGGQAPELFANAAKMENKGFEISLGYKMQIGDLRLNLNGNLSSVRNKIISLAGGQPIESNRSREPGGWLSRSEEGQSVAQFRGYVIEGIYQNYDEIKEHLSEEQSNIDPYTYDRSLEPKSSKHIAPGDYKFKDINNDGIINEEDKTYIGSPLPDFTYGFAINGEYKIFDFSVNLTGVYGNEIANMRKYSMAGYGGTNKIGDYTDNYWTPENTDAKYARPENDRNNNRAFSTLYIEDGSYLKINNIILGATIPKALSSKIMISRLRVYFSIENAYVFTKYSTGYPEVGTTTSYNPDPLAIGVDKGIYPTPRVFMFGANISF
jgi:TonB-dependent starch-binding outer membrane protein SusC